MLDGKQPLNPLEYGYTEETGNLKSKITTEYLNPLNLCFLAPARRVKKLISVPVEFKRHLVVHSATVKRRICV